MPAAVIDVEYTQTDFAILQLSGGSYSSRVCAGIPVALVDENVLYEVIREWRVIKGECIVTMLLARKALV